MGGTVLVWDAETFALQRTGAVTRTLKYHEEATCVAWCAQTMMALVYGPDGVVEAQVTQDSILKEEDAVLMMMRQNNQSVLMQEGNKLWPWMNEGRKSRKAVNVVRPIVKAVQ